MIRARCFFLLFVCATSAAAAQIDDAAAGFVAALTANNIAAFDAVAAGDATALEGLARLRDALERYDCIQISGYRTTILAPLSTKSPRVTTSSRRSPNIPEPPGRSGVTARPSRPRRSVVISDAVEDSVTPLVASVGSSPSTEAGGVRSGHLRWASGP